MQEWNKCLDVWNHLRGDSSDISEYSHCCSLDSHTIILKSWNDAIDDGDDSFWQVCSDLLEGIHRMIPSVCISNSKEIRQSIDRWHCIFR